MTAEAAALKETLADLIAEPLTRALHPWRNYMAIEDVNAITDDLVEALTAARVMVAPEDPEDASDGYHTIRELYEHPVLLTAALFNEWYTDGLENLAIAVKDVHKSKRHAAEDDDPMFPGMFKVSATLLPPGTGQISYHYPLAHWDLFHIPEREYAAAWDGHTAAEAAERLRRFLIGDY